MNCHDFEYILLNFNKKYSETNTILYVSFVFIMYLLYWYVRHLR